MERSIIENARGRIGQIAGLIDEAQYRLRDRARPRGDKKRGGGGDLHDTIADAFTDLLFTVASHLRTQLIEVLGVVAIGPVGDKSVEVLDRLTENALETVQGIVSKIDSAFDALDAVVDLGERVTLANQVVEKPVKFGTGVLDRVMSIVDEILQAVGDRRK